MKKIKGSKLKRDWLKALRSEKYLQGRHELVQENTDGELCYCCLGVLCEVLEKQNIGKILKSTQSRNTIYYQYKDSEDIYLSTLPLDIASDLKICQDTLINMNDTQLSSFLEIAEYIEKNIDFPKEISFVESI